MAREFRLGCDLRSFTSKEIRMAEGIDPSHQHIHEEWHRAASTRDQAALIALYADDAILETPLAPQILVGKPDGILRGRRQIKEFLDLGARKRPDDRVRWYRTGAWFSRGDTLVWEYPRETPGGQQIDIVEVMQIRDGLIRHHRIYWGWLGLRHLMENARSKTTGHDGIEPGATARVRTPE
jgi:steroid delta-isomerase